MATNDKSTISPLLANESLFAMAAGSGGGSGNHGAGGGGGSPGGGTPGGGGGNGGKPGGESVGNNLSFPAVFFDNPSWLNGDPTTFTFTTPTFLDGDSTYVYFAQGVAGNTWQAGSILSGGPITVDYVDIGDALETAPIKAGTNLRLELTLYEALDDPLTGFAMALLGGAKGSGKPSVKGPTESQGARLLASEWDDGIPPYTGDTDTAPLGTTYDSLYASIYAARSTGTETANSFMSMSIQKVTGIASEADLAGLDWINSEWVDADPGGATVGANVFNTAFGPELNIGGKYIMGASGKPFKFSSDGDYLITFAIERNAPISFDDEVTVVANDAEEAPGFQPGLAKGRETWVVDPDPDSHNGLLVMLVGVPSSVDEAGVVT